MGYSSAAVPVLHSISKYQHFIGIYIFHFINYFWVKFDKIVTILIAMPKYTSGANLKKQNWFVLIKEKIKESQECEGLEGRIFSQNFFLIFLFRMTQFAKKSKNKIVKILIFFLSLRNVGDFDLFDPWRENQSFFDMGFSLNVT